MLGRAGLLADRVQPFSGRWRWSRHTFDTGALTRIQSGLRSTSVSGRCAFFRVARLSAVWSSTTVICHDLRNPAANRNGCQKRGQKPNLRGEQPMLNRRTLLSKNRHWLGFARFASGVGQSFPGRTITIVVPYPPRDRSIRWRG